MSDEDRAARAAERRRTWTGGVAKSFAEMEQADLEFWRAATPGERIRAVTLLIEEMCALRGERGPGPRLQRSVGGTRKR